MKIKTVPLLLVLEALLLSAVRAHHLNTHQFPFIADQAETGLSQAYIPLRPDEMTFYNLELSGSIDNRVNLVFFGDGYTESDRSKFLHDAKALAQDIIKPGTSYGPVSKLLNIHAVFVASNESGIGTHGEAKNTPFSLYRPGSELRGVLYPSNGRKRVMEACKYWWERGRGRKKVEAGLGKERANQLNGKRWREFDEVDEMVGCDEPILLGNDPLYGGLGGTPTVITASKVNGPLVLRHELGHTLIPAGEEYDGGYAYFGPNADKVDNLHNISWGHWLTDSEQGIRVEDSKVPLQAYPWLNLTASAYEAVFPSSLGDYPTAFLRFSVSSIPHPFHLLVTIDDIPINFSIPEISLRGKDRAWVQVQLKEGLGAFPGKDGMHRLRVKLTKEGREAEEGQGGKMLTSIEVIEYGPSESFTKKPGYVGAFPTYDEKGHVTLRPTNEECLMRDVTFPNFCSVCLESLYLTLLSRVSLVESISTTCSHSGRANIRLELLELEGAAWSVNVYRVEEWNRLEPVSGIRKTAETRLEVQDLIDGNYRIEVKVRVPEIRKDDKSLVFKKVVAIEKCAP